jgi:hypothetical protein
MFAMTCLAGSVNAQLADDATLETRIQALEKKLVDIEAQLGKLDFIAEHVTKLRNEDLPRIASDLGGTIAAESADDREAASKAASELDTSFLSDAPPLPGDEPEMEPPKLEESEVANKPDLDDPAFSELGDLFDSGDATAKTDDSAAETTDPLGLDDAPKDTSSLEQRTATIEKTVAAIESKLKLLDDIAEAIDALRNDDLAQLRNLLAQRSQKVEAAKPPADGATPSQGMFVVNNWTGTVHWMNINGQRRRIEPGRNRIQVPYDVVKTSLGGQDTDWDMSHWRKVGDEYRLILDLQN